MEEIEEVQCPVCNMSFRDKRGLTSHARNNHSLSKNELYDQLANQETPNNWPLYITLGTALLAIIGLQR